MCDEVSKGTAVRTFGATVYHTYEAPPVIAKVDGATIAVVKRDLRNLCDKMRSVVMERRACIRVCACVSGLRGADGMQIGIGMGMGGRERACGLETGIRNEVSLQ